MVMAGSQLVPYAAQFCGSVLAFQAHVLIEPSSVIASAANFTPLPALEARILAVICYVGTPKPHGYGFHSFKEPAD